MASIAASDGIPFAHLTIFVATKVEEVPSGVSRFASVDGDVPGAVVRWDHHRSGEPTNFDALPETVAFAREELDGVATTWADTDAVVSAAVVLLGGRAALPPEATGVLRSASHWCDHLTPHPDLDDAVNRLGRGLHDAIASELSRHPAAAKSAVFAAQVRDLAGRVARREAFPFEDSWSRQVALADRFRAEGRLRVVEGVGVADLVDAPSIDPSALYRCFEVAVVVRASRHPKDDGLAMTVGANPWVAPDADLTAALRAVAAAEHARGGPSSPAPGGDNWGGRRTVFGSPWNRATRLSVEEVAAIVAGAFRG